MTQIYPCWVIAHIRELPQIRTKYIRSMGIMRSDLMLDIQDESFIVSTRYIRLGDSVRESELESVREAFKNVCEYT